KESPTYLSAIAALGENPTESQKQAVFETLSRNGTLGSYFQTNQAYIDGQKDFAPGGKYNMASQAITGLLASAAGGNLQQGIANAAAPLLASQVGDYFDRQPDTEANNAARLLTHAAVGAAVAYLSGNDAASGAAGAVTGEALAQIIINTRYDGKTSDQLTTAEKEDIRAISTLAATLVGGVTGGSFEDAVTAGAAGYNAVVNNQFAGDWGLADASKEIQLKKISIRDAISIGLDFVPIIGDIKGFVEAESIGDYVFATIGLIPGGGDVIQKSRKAYLTAKAANDVKGMKNALEEVAQACSGGSCFEAGTLIQTDSGFKAIETFVGGELVWSRDEFTGAMGYKPVIATKVTTDQAIYRITVQNKDGQTETFGTTSEHPFWVKDIGWIKASLLEAGTELVDAQNQTLRITHAELTDETATVYNIEIEDYHTYHVGEIGVWVHNANCCSVYTSTNPVTGATQYVGITNNLARREAEHLASKGIRIDPLLQNLSRSDARAVEQALIEINGLGKNGGILINKINSISRTNPSYAAQLQRGYELLKTVGY
ncbi:polymorphic toxin-type HINT domain-containing protein, partial [Formosimonas limnophila]|uniref:polymorphic toxin-type HINT domain-containing protein n=1 Tax=Formosimonas limnophila TaxID=1384487 RepID=UPI001673E4EE